MTEFCSFLFADQSTLKKVKNKKIKYRSTQVVNTGTPGSIEHSRVSWVCKMFKDL